MKIALIPFSTHLENNRIFNPTEAQNRDDCLGPYSEMKYALAQRGINIFTADQGCDGSADVLIFFRFDLGYLIKYLLKFPNVRLIYMAFEPPVVQPLHNEFKLKILAQLFDAVFTFQDNLVDNITFQKLYYPVSMNLPAAPHCEFKSRKLITAIVGNKKSSRKGELYSTRRKALTYFTEKYFNFEFYGSGWSNKEFSSYAGPVGNKQLVLSGYKFAICFENQRDLSGLISEKIFDCFYAQVVPVFIGATNVEEYFPPLTFIDGRKFENYEALDAHISEMSEEEYRLHILAINNYLISESRQLFTGRQLAKQISHLTYEPIANTIKYHKAIIAIFLFIDLCYQKGLHKLKQCFVFAHTFCFGGKNS